MEDNVGLLGRYRLVEEIHSGIMSRLYKAYDPSLGRAVALKTLKTEFSENSEIVERFKREAKTAKALEHPNIIKIHDIGFEDDLHYFTMEYITGPTLRKLLETEGTLSVEKALAIAKMVCVGLHHAHCAQVIHRDIKPSNIALDDNGNVVILDFGIAKVADLAGLTLPGMLIGTPEYMSPEQIRGTTLDGRADLYSLGVVLYELLTGTVPFRGESHSEIANKIVKERPRKPRELNTGLSKDVDKLVLKAIEKDRTRRFTSGLDMANAMNRTLGLPVEDVKETKKPALIEDEPRSRKPARTSERPVAATPARRTSGPVVTKMAFWLPPVIAVGILLILLAVSRPALLVPLVPWFLIPVGLALLIWVLAAPGRSAPSRYSTVQLLLTSGKEVIQAFPVSSEVATIGRDQPEGIEIFKDSISRSHAQIVNVDGVFWVCDLNSKNGTFVNGRRIDKQVLRDGDRISIGGEVLVFHGTREGRR